MCITFPASQLSWYLLLYLLNLLPLAFWLLANCYKFNANAIEWETSQHLSSISLRSKGLREWGALGGGDAALLGLWLPAGGWCNGIISSNTLGSLIDPSERSTSARERTHFQMQCVVSKPLKDSKNILDNKNLPFKKIKIVLVVCLLRGATATMTQQFSTDLILAFCVKFLLVEMYREIGWWL